MLFVICISSQSKLFLLNHICNSHWVDLEFGLLRPYPWDDTLQNNLHWLCVSDFHVKFCKVVLIAFILGTFFFFFFFYQGLPTVCSTKSLNESIINTLSRVVCHKWTLTLLSRLKWFFFWSWCEIISLASLFLRIFKYSMHICMHTHTHIYICIYRYFYFIYIHKTYRSKLPATQRAIYCLPCFYILEIAS